MNTQTQAERFAALMGDDGLCWTAADGRSFEEVIMDFDPEISYATREYGTNGRYRYIEGSMSEHMDGYPIRYGFADGSAIVAAGDAWDIEGAEPFSWANA